KWNIRDFSRLVTVYPGLNLTAEFCSTLTAEKCSISVSAPTTTTTTNTTTTTTTITSTTTTTTTITSTTTTTTIASTTTTTTTTTITTTTTTTTTGVVKVFLTQPNRREQKLAVVSLSECVVNQLLRTAKIKVAWVNCRIRRRVEVTRCFVSATAICRWTASDPTGRH
ncbi:hypothetical protein J6590_099896, partial [Homalodisca vitripennis]